MPQPALRASERGHDREGRLIAYRDPHDGMFWLLLAHEGVDGIESDVTGQRVQAGTDQAMGSMNAVLVAAAELPQNDACGRYLDKANPDRSL